MLASSSGVRGPETLSPSDVGSATFHRSDTCLLMNIVNSCSSILCVLFFTSCEAMMFAETGHSWEECPDLPVSLLMVLYTLQPECENLMVLALSFGQSNPLLL